MYNLIKELNNYLHNSDVAYKKTKKLDAIHTQDKIIIEVSGKKLELIFINGNLKEWK